MAVIKKLGDRPVDDMELYRVCIPLQAANEVEDAGTVQASWASGNDGNYAFNGVPFNVDLANPALSVGNHPDGINRSLEKVAYGAPLRTSAVHMLAFIKYSGEIEDATLVGWLRAVYSNQSATECSLIAGINVSEWAYERPGVDFVVPHKQPPNWGYIFRTNIAADQLYNGKAFYVKMDTDFNRRIERLELLLGPDITVEVDIVGLTVELYGDQSAIPVIEPQASEVTSVTLSGTPTVGGQLDATVQLAADNGGIMGYAWTIADDAAGTNEVPAAIQGIPSYVLTADDAGKYVRCSVRVRTATGGRWGEAVSSDFIGPIA